MLELFHSLKLNSKCADGEDCRVFWRQEDGVVAVRLGKEPYIFGNLLLSEQEFLHQLRVLDRKNKLTPELETELIDQLRRLRPCCDRDEIHEVTDYDS